MVSVAYTDLQTAVDYCGFFKLYDILFDDIGKYIYIRHD